MINKIFKLMEEIKKYDDSIFYIKKLDNDKQLINNKEIETNLFDKGIELYSDFQIPDNIKDEEYLYLFLDGYLRFLKKMKEENFEELFNKIKIINEYRNIFYNIIKDIKNLENKNNILKEDINYLSNLKSLLY